MNIGYSGLLKILLMLILAAMPLTGYAADERTDHGKLIRGFVCDSVSKEPLPGVSVIAEGGKAGTLTDGDGAFILRMPSGVTRLSFSSIGYTRRIIDTGKGSGADMIIVQLQPSDYTMNEVTVTKKKEKYSKKNNPAVDLAIRLREDGKKSDPEHRHPNYNYTKYIKTTLGLNKFQSKEDNPELARKYPFLWENVDTSDVSGHPILTFSVEEKSAQVSHTPGTTKELVTGRRRDGIDDVMDPQIFATFMDETLKEVDIFKPDIDLLYTRFVSPLSPIAPDFYKFYITDTVMIDKDRCTVLTFVPRNTSTQGFVGQIYATDTDSLLFIKKISMRVPKDINLNFIDYLELTQEFRKAPDGSRLKSMDDLLLELSLVPGTKGLYARRLALYRDHSFDPPERPEDFKFLGSEKTAEGAESRDSLFWERERMRPLPTGEQNMEKLRAGLRKIPFFRYGVLIARSLTDGYIHTAPQGKSKFDLGPLNTTVSHNYLEGWRLRLGGVTTPNLSRRLFGKGYVAWGTEDHKWLYGGEVEYSFIDKKNLSFEFPVRSVRLSHKYDINQLGQHFLFTNPDNMFVSWQRMKDVLIDYRRSTRIEWTMEWENNFSFIAGVEHVRQEATPCVPFTNGIGHSFTHYNQISLTLQLRFAPGERFFQTTSQRLPARPTVPVFILRHKVSPGGVAGNMFTINRTEFDVKKRFHFSAWGYLDGIVKAGHIWTRVAYPDLIIPNANLSYTIQPESFALMNPMEFLSDSFVQWDLTYWANGAIFNYIPLIKKLGLREAFVFRGVWGTLSSKNNPALSPDVFRFPSSALATPMNHGPYMEVSAGLDNIARCLRVDYVWRLSYRSTPGIDHSGVRIAFHASF